MDLHPHVGEEGGLAEQIYAQLHERISTYLNQRSELDHFVTQIQGEVCRAKN
jgi:hypothetical protein